MMQHIQKQKIIHMRASRWWAEINRNKSWWALHLFQLVCTGALPKLPSSKEQSAVQTMWRYRAIPPYRNQLPCATLLLRTQIWTTFTATDTIARKRHNSSPRVVNTQIQHLNKLHQWTDSIQKKTYRDHQVSQPNTRSARTNIYILSQNLGGHLYPKTSWYPEWHLSTSLVTNVRWARFADVDSSSP